MQQPTHQPSHTHIHARSYDAETLRSQISTAYPQIPSQWVDSIVAQTSEASGQPPSPFGKLMACSQVGRLVCWCAVPRHARMRVGLRASGHSRPMPLGLQVESLLCGRLIRRAPRAGGCL